MHTLYIILGLIVAVVMLQWIRMVLIPDIIKLLNKIAKRSGNKSVRLIIKDLEKDLDEDSDKLLHVQDALKQALDNDTRTTLNNQVASINADIKTKTSLLKAYKEALSK